MLIDFLLRKKLFFAESIIFLGLSLFFCISIASVQAASDTSRKGELIFATLEKYHYNPIQTNAHIISDIKNVFVSKLDPNGNYLTSADVNEIRASSLFEEKNTSGRDNICKTATRIYTQRLKESGEIISTLLAKPLDYSVKESGHLNSIATVQYATNKQELEKRWRLWYKYQILLSLYLKQYDDGHTNCSVETLLAKEPKIREEMFHSASARLKTYLADKNGIKDDVEALYLDAIAARFDPHSSYLPFDAMRNFNDSLSTSALSFGIEMERDSGSFLSIKRLVPGGSAWRSGQMNQGDKILLFKLSDGRNVDPSIYDIEEIKSFLDTEKTGRLEFTLKKKNGEIRKVSLVKGLIRPSENIITSQILNGKTKIGYICLPGFYTEFESPGEMGCTTDIAREILKLKREGIQGLILDLRNNGGGSLSEALNLAGIFIDQGPLCIESLRDKKAHIVRDMNRGTVYDGPLLLMVNGASASASELLAAILQEHHRALIAGSPTFGKATGQVILPMDPAYNLNFSMRKKWKDYVRITDLKLYCLNSTTYQLTGVRPDILIPSYFESFEKREKDLEYPQPSDTVDKSFSLTDLLPLPIAALSAKSATRISADTNFRKIKKISVESGPYLDGKKRISLEVSEFCANMGRQYASLSRIAKISKQGSPLYQAVVPLEDRDVLKMDTFRRDVSDEFISGLQGDIFLTEAYQIVSDLINIKK